MARERVVDVYVPVIAPSGGGFGGVGAIFAGVAAAVLFAVLVLLVVVAVFPSPRHEPTGIRPGTCEPFCRVSTTAAPVPSAQFPFGGERR